MKQKTTFYVYFKNVPYSDEEWKRTNTWREKFRLENSRYVSLHPEQWVHLTTRPCHSTKFGPVVYSHEKARKVCEEALHLGAQMAGYSTYGQLGPREVWSIRRGGNWRKSE